MKNESLQLEMKPVAARYKAPFSNDHEILHPLVSERRNLFVKAQELIIIIIIICVSHGANNVNMIDRHLLQKPLMVIKHKFFFSQHLMYFQREKK